MAGWLAVRQAAKKYSRRYQRYDTRTVDREIGMGNKNMGCCEAEARGGERGEAGKTIRSERNRVRVPSIKP